MQFWISELALHGYSILFAAVFMEAIGLPLPAALALLLAGGASARGSLQGSYALGGSLIAMLAGDTLMFLMGRYTGWFFLGVLCRISLNPESCILRSAESFYKRGRATLVFAKFIPGINSMAPPLAGSMKMPYVQFLALDFLGAVSYAFAYGGVGFVFRDFVATIARGFRTAGHVVEIVVIIAAIVFTAYRLWLFWKHRVYRIVPRIQVNELAAKLQTQYSENILLADVRSHGYYDPGAARIRGSIRLEPNNLSEEIKILPKDKDIYLYCT